MIRVCKEKEWCFGGFGFGVWVCFAGRGKGNGNGNRGERFRCLRPVEGSIVLESKKTEGALPLRNSLYHCISVFIEQRRRLP